MVRRTICSHRPVARGVARFGWLSCLFCSTPMSNRSLQKKNEDTRSSGLRPSHKYRYSIAGLPDANHSLPSGLWMHPENCPLQTADRRWAQPLPSAPDSHRVHLLLAGSRAWQDSFPASPPVGTWRETRLTLPRKPYGWHRSHPGDCPESAPSTVRARPAQQAKPFTDKV